MNCTNVKKAMLGLILTLAYSPAFSENVTKQDWRFHQRAGHYTATTKAELIFPNKEPHMPRAQQMLSLQDAVLLALRHNPDILNSEIDRLVAKYGFNLVEHAYHWQYGLVASGGYVRSKIEGTRLPGSSHAVITPTLIGSLPTGAAINAELDESRDSFHFHPRAKFSIAQPLLRGANRQVLLKAHYDALDEETISRMQLKEQIAATILEVTRAYHALVLANNNLITAKQSLAEIPAPDRPHATQIDFIPLPSTANIGVEAQVASLRLRLIENRNNVLEAKQALLQVIGLQPDLAIEVPSDVTLSAPPIPSEETAVTQALMNNLAYQKTLLSFKQHQRDLIKANDDLRWQVDLIASSSLGGGGALRSRDDLSLNELVNGKNHSESLDVNVRIPIDDYAAKVEKARATTQLDKDQNSLQKAKLGLIKDIKNSVIHLQNQAQELELAKESVGLERKNYELQVKKQELGKGTAMDVTNSQNALIQARIGYITAKVGYLNARAELDEKLGMTVERWNIQIRY